MSNIIELKTLTTEGARSATTSILEGFGGRDCVRSVVLNTKEVAPDPFEDSANWPVRLQCRSRRRGFEEFEIRILMMTSGYKGTETQDLIDVLLYAGFQVDKERLFRETINETWTKDEDE